MLSCTITGLNSARLLWVRKRSSCLKWEYRQCRWRRSSLLLARVPRHSEDGNARLLWLPSCKNEYSLYMGRTSWRSIWITLESTRQQRSNQRSVGLGLCTEWWWAGSGDRRSGWWSKKLSCWVLVVGCHFYVFLGWDMPNRETGARTIFEPIRDSGFTYVCQHSQMQFISNRRNPHPHSYFNG